MDVFALREKLVGDYRRYAESFLTIRDERIAAHVQAKLDEGLLWPDPPLQLNPSFEPGGLIDGLIDDGVLHDECRRIFRAAKSESDPVGRAILLHKHQADAIRAASTGANYVLTTGTGSGKSLAYIVPIVDYVLRSGAGDGRIKAIVVYPMNALANSQENELAKFLKLGYPQGKPPVTFRRYTGQESEEQRDEIRNNPPDILLTNYVMLEYLLTRPVDGAVDSGGQGLPFLVLDELHTYRGRQGADVALLVRRVRERCQAKNLRCVGTSATMAGPGTFAEQQAEVARVASRLFGAAVEPKNVIGETLRPATVDVDVEDPAFRSALAERVRQRRTARQLRRDGGRPAGVLDRAHDGYHLGRDGPALPPLRPATSAGREGRGCCAPQRADGHRRRTLHRSAPACADARQRDAERRLGFRSSRSACISSSAAATRSRPRSTRRRRGTSRPAVSSTFRDLAATAC